MQPLYIISALTGTCTILASLFLLYTRKITLDAIIADSTAAPEALQAELFDKIKLSSNVPAIALFLIGLLLIIIPLMVAPTREPMYAVRGTVTKMDASDARDILIIPRYPPLSPSAHGEIVGLDVWRGPDGKLPLLAFTSPANPEYFTEAVDLNDPSKVEITNDEITLKEPIVLKRLQ